MAKLSALLLLFSVSCFLPRQALQLGAHARIYTIKLTAGGAEGGMGTGVFVRRTEKGAIVLTARHVVEGAFLIVVQSSRGRAVATVAATHASADIVALQVAMEPEALISVARLPPSVEDRVRALGTSPLDTPAVVSGMVSTVPVICERGHTRQDCRYSTLPVGPGFSGSAVVNDDGQLVGVILGFMRMRPFLGVYADLPAISELLNMVP